MTAAGPVVGAGEGAGAGLVADLSVTRGAFRLDLALAVAPGEVAVLVGPNGAGKSTALQVIAGLLHADRARISLDGRTLDDAGGGSGIRVPPAGRGIGVVFQDYLLFPHLTSTQNVAFGLRARGVPRRTAEGRARDRLAALGLEDHADARPHELSGGQAQRVALARALVLEPRLLLLDEPLAALDAGTRVDVRTRLAAELARFGGATVLVTHDPIDAMVLGDELIVLRGGAVVQRGAPADVASRPIDDYVAQLVGLNLVRSSGGDAVVFPPSAVRLSIAGTAFADAVAGADARASTRSLRCRVRGIEDRGGFARVLLDVVDGLEGGRLMADLSAAELAGLDLASADDPGADPLVWATFPADSP
jgi:molybdate transport system ATP-binding protein